MSEAEFKDRYHLRHKRSAFAVDDKFNKKDRQQRCIEFFEENGTLIETAEERAFADDFLCVYFHSTVNIDYFIWNSVKLSLVEVKYKFETADNTIGLNSGAAQLFCYLEKRGIPIYNAILYNSTKNKNISVFELLDKTKGYVVWKMALLHDPSKYAENDAPEYTSIDGKKTQKYVSFPFEDYVTVFSGKMSQGGGAW